MKYFGTDGIRGKAYDYINESMAYAVGRSLYLLKAKRIIISRDTRESGHMIVREIKRGILDSGLEVIDIDIQSTPVLAFMTIQKSCYGVMVTASHNPYQDNGIKIFNKGIKITPDQEKIIEDVIDGIITLNPIMQGKEILNYNPLFSYFSLYESFITPTSLKIVFDLANGASIKPAKHVLLHVSNDIEFIGDEPNGFNINQNVGSTHMEHVVNYVKENKFDIGFAFDGDGDRVLTCDSSGNIIDGDLMIYIFAIYLKENNLLKNNTVVLSKMSNLGIIEALNSKNIKVVLSDVGDKYVLQEMEKHGSILGGENSGHVINKNLFISGDGLLNAVYLIKILTEKNTTLSELIKDVVFYPDRLYNLRNVDKTLVHHPKVISLINEITKELDGKGKVLVRASGTEPLIRISASARKMELVNDIIDRIVKTLESIQQERK